MLPLPNGSFACITADPPWSFKSNSRAKPGRNAMRHYDCMTLDEIAALPVADIAADNAILWFWISFAAPRHRRSYPDHVRVGL